MAYINFSIPEKKGDLLNTSFSNNYSVKNVTGVKELPSEIKSMCSWYTNNWFLIHIL